MDNENFKVYTSKKYLVLTICLVLIIGILMIITVTLTKFNDLDIFIFVLFSPIFLFLIINELLFRVIVSGVHIKVRSKWGRKYEFNLSDINMVTCEKTHSAKSGTSYFILVITETEKLRIPDIVTGFDQMAGYLLDNYDTGEIKQEAISKKCREKLNMYKNNQQRSKRKNKKV